MATAMVKHTLPGEIVGHDERALMAAPISSLPSIAEVRQRMAWLTEMRPVMLEYVQKHMDPARHMYSFENNRYTPLTIASLHAMVAEGKKPALNQDGIHNLMSLYDCYVAEPTITELREDGFYTCRATVMFISFRTGQPMGSGTGSCSTRESKYAYRWVYDRDIPQGVDKGALKSKTFTPEGKRAYTRYRLDNEDLADVEATVLKMAVKRAKSAGVQAFPLVSEMFAAVGDVDEDNGEGDAERQELLKPIGVWLKSMKPTTRVKAILAVFGEPLSGDDVGKLEEDRLAVARQVIEIATKAGIDWGSPTVLADLKGALAASAAKARAELFDNDPRGSTPTNGSPVVDVEPGEVREPSHGQKQGLQNSGDSGGRKEVSPIAPWRRTIEARLIDSDALRGVIPPAFYTQCLAAFERPTFSDQAGGELVAQLEEWILAAQDAHDDEEPRDG